MPTTTATVPLLHRFLGIGLVMLAAAFAGFRQFALRPVLNDDVSQPVAYTLSGIALVLAFVAYFVLKPRVPDRTPGQSVEQYWSTAAVVTKVLPVWFLLEGGGTIAAVGYYLTGEPVAAVATGLAIAGFWLCGPDTFAKA